MLSVLRDFGVLFRLVWYFGFLSMVSGLPSWELKLFDQKIIAVGVFWIISNHSRRGKNCLRGFLVISEQMRSIKGFSDPPKSGEKQNWRVPQAPGDFAVVWMLRGSG